MSGREFVAGDVAMAERAVGVGQTEVGVYLRTDAHLPWTGSDNCSYSDRELHCLRPLAVIDPESLDDRDRFCTLVLRESIEAVLRTSIDDQAWSGISVAIQRAFREFANPTPAKPDEPTGLGAVVEDAEGVLWVRLLREGSDSTRDDWRRAGYTSGDEGRRVWHFYEDISAVRVLSEGVTA